VANKDQKKRTLRDAEDEILVLSEKIIGLQKELIAARQELFQAQMKQVENYFRVALQERNMDWAQYRRHLQKKYHPDVNAGKTFTAAEVMADLNPLLKVISDKTN